MDGQHDPAFLQILSEEKNIANFLDAFFGFLFRWYVFVSIHFDIIITIELVFGKKDICFFS